MYYQEEETLVKNYKISNIYFCSTLKTKNHYFTKLYKYKKHIQINGEKIFLLK